MKLFELFDKQNLADVTITRDTKHQVHGTFDDPDGNEYHVYINYTASPGDHPDDDGPRNSWTVSFDTEHDGQSTDKAIGGRRALPIFGTVFNLVLKVIRDRKIDEIWFEASSAEKSRVRLYRRLAGAVAKRLGWKVKEVPAAAITFIVTDPAFSQDRWHM